VWLFLINDEKEKRCDTGPHKLAEPIDPEIRPVGQPQHSNANGNGGVESAPGNLSHGSRYIKCTKKGDLVRSERSMDSIGYQRGLY
jgi:hypothetical protein